MIEKELYIDVLEYLQDGGNWSQKLEIVEINSYKEIGNFIINDMLEKIPHTDNMKIKQIVCMYLNYSQEQYSKLHYTQQMSIKKYYIIIQRLKISI